MKQLKMIAAIIVATSMLTLLVWSGREIYVPTNQDAVWYTKTLLTKSCAAADSTGSEYGMYSSCEVEVLKKADMGRHKWVWVIEGQLELKMAGIVIESVPIALEIRWKSGHPRSYDSWRVLYSKMGSDVIVDERNNW